VNFFDGPSEKLDTRWRKSFQIKCTWMYFDNYLNETKTWRFLLKLISILFRFFFISNMQLKCHKHTHLLARYLFPTIWKFFKDFAILLLHPMQFSMGRNRVMNELCALFAASWAFKISWFSPKNSERTDGIHILSLSFSPLPQSPLRYPRLSLILPSYSFVTLFATACPNDRRFRGSQARRRECICISFVQ